MDNDRGTEKIDAQEYFRSINGFEEIAIETVFRRSVTDLAQAAEDGNVFLFMRSLLFVEAKRAGVKDAQAYRDVMNLRIDDVVEQFQAPSDAEGKSVAVTESSPLGTAPTPDSWFAPESHSQWTSSLP